MPIPPDIIHMANEATRLSHDIEGYDHAPVELRDTVDFLKGLERDLGVRKSRMEKLVEKRKAEHKDLDKLQRSGTRRLFVRMKHGGKDGLERRLEKEEREYIEAAQNEHNENKAISELQAAADTAKQKKAELESQVARRKETLEKLDDLYKSAFEGPSPDFPEEDAAENELKDAETHFEQAQSRLTHEKSVFSILDQAATCANQTQAALQSANLSATYDTFQIGGLWAQMAEADDLVRAQTLSAKAQRLLERARSLQPLVKPVPAGKIVLPEWLNVVFDNLYTDYVFQQKIKQSIESVQRYQQGIYAECAASEDRVKTFEQDAKEAKDFLNSRRRQLVAIRREILARIREEGGVRVFTGPGGDGLRDGSGRSIPQLPTYAQQPEEGARILATGVSSSAISLPAPETSTPPQYSSQSDLDLPPSFPEVSASSITQSRLYASPPGPPPSASSPASSSPSSAPRMPDTTRPVSSPVPNDGATGARSDDAGIDQPGLASASDATPRPSTLIDGIRNGSRQTSFASNNPYRHVR